LEIRFEFLRLLVEQLTKSFFNRSDKHLETILGTPDQVVFERLDRANTDAISGIHHETSVAQKLDKCKQINREIASLCPLKRAVLCGFESMDWLARDARRFRRPVAQLFVPFMCGSIRRGFRRNIQSDLIVAHAKLSCPGAYAANWHASNAAQNLR
jgi:hypothetical protein